MTSCDVIEVKHKARGYEALCATGEKYFGDKLIIACGGAAGKKLGGSKSGYHLLRSSVTAAQSFFLASRRSKRTPRMSKHSRACAPTRMS